MLPGAGKVEIIDALSGDVIATLTLRHKAGLYEGKIPPIDARAKYRLRVIWAKDKKQIAHDYADAYTFGSQLADADLAAFRAGTHVRPYTMLGAHALTCEGVAGVRFALWAPNARRASVVGSFNNWDGRRHPMRLRHEYGVWEIFMPHVAIGDLYKFEILSAHGVVLPQKADPFARAAQLRPETASKVADTPPMHAITSARANANQRKAPISIYEVHLASWRHAATRAPGQHFDDWDTLAATLPAYVAELGFTHLELMPISEYPFDGSWGYQTLGLYAASARHGSAEAFGRFVAACHAHGVGLLLDWVPAHFPADVHGLAAFDGSQLFEYADPREGFHRDWNTLIYNFGRNEVKSFLAGSALYWMERFGVDGLRVDAVASMLYRDYSRPAGQWVPNIHGGRENLEAIALLKHVNEIIGRETPGAITAAEESTAFPGVSAPTSAGGLGFHYKWNMGWMNDTLKYIEEDPIHRQHHHDKITFGLSYAFSENFILPISHDEVVHGKRSLLQKMPGDDWQKFANLRAYYGFMWGHPGKKLLFMGQEFAQPHEWRHDRDLPWPLLGEERHRGVQQLVHDLNRLYREHSALHELDCDAAGFEWLIADDKKNSVFAWMRRDAAGTMVMVVSNFTPVPRADYVIGVPAGSSAWKEILNTDSAHYGGSNVGNGGAALQVTPITNRNHAQSITITIPPLATIFLAPKS